jgi:hypothetical protein
LSPATGGALADRPGFRAAIWPDGLLPCAVGRPPIPYIKIPLDSIVADGDKTEKQRNELLADMTDEVARLVLRVSYCKRRG